MENLETESLWNSPTSHDGRRPGVDETSTQGANLNRQTGTWPTPRAEDSESCGNHPGKQDSLRGAIEEFARPAKEADLFSGVSAMNIEEPVPTASSELWPTPAGMAGVDATGKQGLGGEFAKSVEQTMSQWATPRNQMSAGTKEATWAPGEMPRNKDGEPITTTITDQVRIFQESLTGPQAPPPEPNGSASLPSGPTSRPRLNPRFVEWLQGLPMGWATLQTVEPMSFARWEMQSSRLVARLLFAFCGSGFSADESSI
jgi:hypothetical protein